MSLKIGSLFSGYGGLDLATEAFFGASTAWHVEFDKAPSRILEARWPGVPNYGDVTKVDWASVEPVDILTGGFPCQDLSLAGRRQGMRPGTRSGLWADYVKAIAALNPSVVVIENVRGLLSGCAESDLGLCEGCVGDGEHRPVLRALGRVLGDLAGLGFDAEWAGIRASDVGAPHGRFRVFVLAYRPGVGREWAGIARDGRRRPADGDLAPVTALLPTPAAMNPNDEEDIDKWQERRARVKLDKQNGNGFGTPLGVAVRILPTTTAQDANASGGSNPSNVTLTDATTRLMPTPRATRGGSQTELMYGLGAERDDTGDAQGNVTLEEVASWGQYEGAVRRWEALTRPAPSPTLPDGKDGNHRLNAAFAEWMMGVPAGWITDVDITRREQLKACGNGVVPQQAYAALDGLWARVKEATNA